MTVRAYIRVSTTVQAAEGHSLAAQRTRAEAWATYQAIGPLQIYEDAGISGTRDDRPGLAALLLDLQPGDTVLVYALARLTRGGAVQLLGIVRDIREKKARLVSLQESIDTESSTGRLMLTILAALAELEVEQTKERVEMGRTQAALDGFWPHADDSLPAGWITDADRRIVEDQPHADIVRLIFAQGRQAYNKTAKMLNERGLLGRRGGLWEAFQVRRVVMFRGYATGQFPYRAYARPDAPEEHINIPAPPLVTLAEWEAAQRERTVNHAHSMPDIYPLTGHIRCGCGTRLAGRRRVKKPRGGVAEELRWYVCYGAARRTEVCPINGRNTNSYPLPPLHVQARELMAHVLNEPYDPAHIGAIYGGVAVADPHVAERADIERRLDALLDLYLEKLVEREAYERRRRSLMQRLEELKAPAPAPAPLAVPRRDLAALVLDCPNVELAELLDRMDVEFAVRDGILTLERYRPIKGW